MTTVNIIAAAPVPRAFKQGDFAWADDKYLVIVASILDPFLTDGSIVANCHVLYVFNKVEPETLGTTIRRDVSSLEYIPKLNITCEY